MTVISQPHPVVTVITPVFNESGNLDRYESTIREQLFRCPEIRYRVLFVDDGSTDDSWQSISRICAKDPRFEALRLSRNFGPHIALAAGLHHAAGDAVAILACDLQDPPEVIREFVEHWRSGASIVWGKRRTRQDSGFRVAASRFFEEMVRRYAMPPRSQFVTGSFLLMDRHVLECYRSFQETNRITFALVGWTGFSQQVVEYDRQARLAGKSSWKLHKLVRAAYDTMLAFSRIPFGLITALGAFLFLLSLPLSVYLVLCYVTGNPQPGWTSLMLALTMFFGVHFIFMSVQGEYLSRIYSESVRRPLYFVSESTRLAREPNRDAA